MINSNLVSRGEHTPITDPSYLAPYSCNPHPQRFRLKEVRFDRSGSRMASARSPSSPSSLSFRFSKSVLRNLNVFIEFASPVSSFNPILVEERFRCN